MDPFTALTIASTAFSAVGAIKQGNDAAGQAKAEGQAAQYNAGIARQNAATSRAEAASAEWAKRQQSRAELGAASATIAQAGIGSGGSASAALTQGVRASELDALNIRYGGETKAQGLESEATMSDAQALAAKRRAASARTSGYLGAATAVMQGGANYMTGSATRKLAGAQLAALKKGQSVPWATDYRFRGP